jgi:anti-anti-sigma factor
MKIIQEEINGIILLHISDFMVADTIDILKKVIRQFQGVEKNKVILNLEKVRMIDSSGIGAIAFMIKRFRGSGGDLKIANAKGNVAEIFEITKLYKTIDMYDSVRDALESFRA